MNNRNTILIIVAVILVGIIGFAVGSRYQWRQMAFNYNGSQVRQVPYGGMMGGWGRGRMMGRGYSYSRGLLRGTVASVNGNNLTLTLANGQQYTVTLSDQAQVEQAQTVSKSNLKNGQTVVVYSAPQSSGSATQTVLILP